MKPAIQNPNFTIFFFFFFFLVISLTFNLSPSLCDDDPNYEQFSSCANLPYNCADLRNISYPFWGDTRPPACGRTGFELKCHNNLFSTIAINSSEFRVLEIVQSSSRMKIARDDLLANPCSLDQISDTIDYSLFHFPSTVHNFTVFYTCSIAENCSESSDYVNQTILQRFRCSSNNVDNFFVDETLYRESNTIRSLSRCCRENFRVPLSNVLHDRELIENRTEALEKGLKEGFEVEYDSLEVMRCNACVRSHGSCGSNSTHQFLCYCKGQVEEYSCPVLTPAKKNVKKKIIIGLCTGFGGIFLTCIFFFIWLRHKKMVYAPSSFVSKSISSDPSSVNELEKGGNYLGVHLFSYAELEEATNRFDSAKVLGDGGFGMVYYGILRDGRAVAVKRLYENNYKRVEQFMNEVEILTRLRHEHLVSLYGCTSRHSRELLLVYEYVPNGTVADHIHGERAKPGELPWPTRMKIAIQTAYALVYLHASDIIHRDVKTNNILLDNSYCVKVADFGLSRLFPTDVTHVSTAPQGTPGYVDPEYHECYHLTDRSDVFSFGVVLVELISSKPAVDITRHRHEINLSNMAINKIQNHALHELVDPNLGFDSDCRVREMIIAVAELAFRCLQGVKENRPSMIQVFEELKSIQIKKCDKEKAEEIDISADDVVLLKSGPFPVSPDSVATH